MCYRTRLFDVLIHETWSHQSAYHLAVSFKFKHILKFVLQFKHICSLHIPRFYQ